MAHYGRSGGDDDEDGEGFLILLAIVAFIVIGILYATGCISEHAAKSILDFVGEIFD